MKSGVTLGSVIRVIFIGLLIQPVSAYAQLNCGSTGSNGALNVAANQTVTLDVPNDGIFNFTTVSVAGTLVFNRNAAFNSPVIMLASGDVLVANGGTVRVNGSAGSTATGGSAGPGGFDGGAPGIGGANPGAGHGPGAGAPGIGALFGGNAGYGEPGQNNSTTTEGAVYGSALLVPLAGGSGGGGNDNDGGGGGGGAILLCSPSQITINGVVDALGGSGSGSSANGSGGAIRVLSPAVRGNGALRVQGGGSGWGGRGRARVDLIDRSGFALSSVPTAAMSVGSLMAVFPSTVPRLDIVSVAGNGIGVGAASPLVFTLPLNSTATQAVTVRATNFSGIVPISVVATPDSGNRIVIDTEINADVAPAETTVTINLPQNIAVRIHAWTR